MMLESSADADAADADADADAADSDSFFPQLSFGHFILVIRGSVLSCLMYRFII
jgi:hypothetical protein